MVYIYVYTHTHIPTYPLDIYQGVRLLDQTVVLLSLVISNVEHIFMYLLTIFFGKMSIQVLCPF